MTYHIYVMNLAQDLELCKELFGLVRSHLLYCSLLNECRRDMLIEIWPSVTRNKQKLAKCSHTLSPNSPKYTFPNPPRPIILDSSKLFVASSISSRLKIIVLSDSRTVTSVWCKFHYTNELISSIFFHSGVKKFL